VSETKRIRWEDAPAAGEARGYVGSLDTPVFRLWAPDADGDRVLFAFVAGALGDAYHGTDEDEQKARAERLLEEFASSLGAIFPEAVLALADDWAALAPPDDWGESMAGTVAADCGRAVRAAITTALTGTRNA
jgi:hypothetical protein